MPILSSIDATPDYEIGEELGVGGIASVNRAVDRNTGQECAIKTLDEAFIGEIEVEECFLREARLLARLQHPGIVTVYDYGRSFDGAPYYTMELLGGSNLSDAIRFSNLTLNELVNYCVQAANALAYLHRVGVVHRDVKAENVVIDGKGRATLIDLGVAGVAGESSEALIVGTPRCMAPEQITGEAFDHRLDIWAFGVMLYEGVTGRSPFYKGHEEYEEVFQRIRYTKARPIDHSIPAQLRELIALCLQVDPEMRPDSMEAVESTLYQILEDSEVGAEPSHVSGRSNYYHTPIASRARPVRPRPRVTAGPGPWTQAWLSAQPSFAATIAECRPHYRLSHTVCVTRGVGLNLLRESALERSA